MKRRKVRLQTREVRREDVSITGEAEYIVARAIGEDARIVSLPPLVFFSTTIGDAWILDAEGGLAVQLAAAKARLPFAITETPERFAIEWPGTFRIDGDTMMFTDKSGRVRAIVGYPTQQIVAQFRGYSRSARRRKSADEAALASYAANLRANPSVLNDPHLAFAFCYLASHYGLRLLTAERVDELMADIERNRKALARLIAGGPKSNSALHRTGPRDARSGR